VVELDVGVTPLISAAITAASGNSGKGHKSETRLSLERNSA